MAVVIDGSSPAIVNGTGTGTLVTASFTPPAGSLLVAVVIGGWSGTSGTTTASVSDSRSLTWTARATVNGASNNSTNFGGIVTIYTAPVVSSASMTVTATYSFPSGGGGKQMAVYVITGGTTGGATATVDQTASGNTLACSITTTQANSLVLGGVDENKGSRTLTASAGTSFSSLSGTNPVDDVTDVVDMAVIQSPSTVATPGTYSYGVQWTGSTGVGKAALIEIVPGNTSVSSGDTGSGFDTASAAATAPAADTGVGVDNAAAQITIAAADTASGVDAAQITALATETASASEANKILSGGSTLAFGSDTATGVESAAVLAYDSDAATSAEVSTLGVVGRLNAGPRIVRVQPEDRSHVVPPLLGLHLLDDGEHFPKPEHLAWDVWSSMDSASVVVLGTEACSVAESAASPGAGDDLVKFLQTIGDGTTTSFTITHNMGTRDVVVAVYDAVTYEDVLVTSVVRTTLNTVTVNFPVAPTTNAYRVVVLWSTT